MNILVLLYIVGSLLTILLPLTLDLTAGRKPSLLKLLVMAALLFASFRLNPLIYNMIIYPTILTIIIIIHFIRAKKGTLIPSKAAAKIAVISGIGSMLSLLPFGIILATVIMILHLPLARLTLRPPRSQQPTTGTYWEANP